MKTLLNIIWLVFGGLWLALGYFLAGVVCRRACPPPSGRTATTCRRRSGVFSLLGNVIWLLVAGIWIAIGHVVTAFAMAVTIIGIPLAIANLKLIPVSLMPLGKQIVPTNGPFVSNYPVSRYR